MGHRYACVPPTWIPLPPPSPPYPSELSQSTSFGTLLHASNLHYIFFSSGQFSSVAHLCLTLCNPMDCSTLGFPVHHQLLELAQTHVHWVGDAIQPSHLLLSPSPPTFNLSQYRVFSNESVLPIRWPKYWSFSFSISPSKEYSGMISLGTY